MIAGWVAEVVPCQAVEPVEDGEDVSLVVDQQSVCVLPTDARTNRLV